MVAWRLGLLSPDPRRLKMYRVIALSGLLVGGSATALKMLPVAACPRLAPVAPVAACLANIPFALGYLALVLWAAAAGRWKRLRRLLAPAGRMALTNYLSQSIVLSFVFFSFGLACSANCPRRQSRSAGSRSTPSSSARAASGSCGFGSVHSSGRGAR
jgi:uncharacterized protein